MKNSLTRREREFIENVLEDIYFEYRNVNSIISDRADKILNDLAKLDKLIKAENKSTPASASSASPALSQGLTANNERGQGNA